MSIVPPSVGDPTGATWADEITTAINALLNPPRFIGSIPSGTYITADVNFPFAADEDPLSGWDSSDRWWTCPVAGLYDVRGQFVAGSAIQAILSVQVNGTQVFYSPGAVQSVTIDYGGTTIAGYIRLNVGDQVAVQSSNTWTTKTDTGVGTSFALLRVSA